jgi:putative FmdB family regulatory protein
MPRYVFECPRCKVQTERDRKIAERDADLPDCPECHHIMPRVPSAPTGNVPFPGAASWRS